MKRADTNMLITLPLEAKSAAARPKPFVNILDYKILL